MSKVLFAIPYQVTFGIECLSAYLKEKGHTVECYYDPWLFDGIYFNSKTLARRFDHTEHMLEFIEDFQPDIICFSAIYEVYHWCVQKAEAIKSRFDIPIVIGGIHPTSVPEHVLEHRCFDYVVIGEGEQPLAELVEALENREPVGSIRNLAFRDGEDVRIVPIRPLIHDLDTLPFPDKELLKRIWTKQHKGRYLTMASRGCGNTCSYCCHSFLRGMHKGKGTYVRRRSVDNFIEELSRAKSKYDLYQIVINDENITSSRRWLREFAPRYKKEVGLPYFCWVSPSTIDEERAALLKESGCKHVEIGIQNAPGSDLVKVTGRVHQDESIERSLKLLKKANFFITTDNIIGLPGQTKEDIKKQIRMYIKYPVDQIAVYWLRYYPRTAIVNIALKEGILSREDVKKIDRGGHGLSFNKPRMSMDANRIHLGNLLRFSAILPNRVISWLLKSEKRYHLIPKSSFLLIPNLLLTLQATYLHGRTRIHYLTSPFTFIMHFVRHCTRRLLWRPKKKKAGIQEESTTVPVR